METLGGFVTSGRSFIGAQRKIDQEGLFSEIIFGPTRNYCCACGNYNSKVLYSGKVCPKCGVLCASNDTRYEIFGKIKMIFPVIKPSKKDKFLKIIGEKNKTLINPIRADANSALTRYIALKTDQSGILITDSLNQISNYMVIPFRITGIYSLYLCLKFIYTCFNVPDVSEIFNNKYLDYEIKVLPPNLRMVSYDDSKKEIRTPEINKCYTSILNLNKANTHIQSNLHIDEQDWLDKIRVNLKNNIFDQDIVEPTIIEYDLKTAHYQWWCNEIYRMVYNELSGKAGLIRSSILGKNIEFSARSVITVDPSLPPYEIKVGKSILKKLWMPYFIHYITKYRNFEYDWSCENFIANEKFGDSYSDKLFDEFLEWFQQE